MCNDNAAIERPTKRQKLASEDGTETFPVADTAATSQTEEHGKCTDCVSELLNRWWP